MEVNYEPTAEEKKTLCESDGFDGCSRFVAELTILKAKSG